MKVLWYVGNINDKCSSLVILGEALQKYSKHEIVLCPNDIDFVLNSDADFLIGSYRFFQDDTRDAIKEKFGDNCGIFVHGINKDEVRCSKTLEANYKSYDTRLYASCYYMETYMYSHARAWSRILPFGVEPVPRKPYRTEGKPVFGMVYQKRKAHRKGVDIIDKARKHGMTMKTATDIPHDKMGEFYESIDCLIVASDDDGRESFCIPMMEAASHGCAIISTAVGCSNILVGDRHQCAIIEGKHNIISRMLNTSLEAFNIRGQNLYEHVMKNYTWDMVIKRWDYEISHHDKSKKIEDHEYNVNDIFDFAGDIYVIVDRNFNYDKSERQYSVIRKILQPEKPGDVTPYSMVSEEYLMKQKQLTETQARVQLKLDKI